MKTISVYFKLSKKEVQWRSKSRQLCLQCELDETLDSIQLKLCSTWCISSRKLACKVFRRYRHALRAYHIHCNVKNFL